MARLRWTEPALRDLETVAEYIALDNPAAARRYVQQVFAAGERLEQFPKSGSVPPERTTKGGFAANQGGIPCRTPGRKARIIQPTA
jgi:plasmid stabilization system protein ParE